MIQEKNNHNSDLIALLLPYLNNGRCIGRMTNGGIGLEDGLARLPSLVVVWEASVVVVVVQAVVALCFAF